jgi:hypothetical protein
MIEKQGRPVTVWPDTLRDTRRNLEAERRRVLLTLREARDKIRQIGQLSETDTPDLDLAFDIVITVAERESFLDMPAERIPVVLRQLEIRLLRLKGMIRDLPSSPHDTSDAFGLRRL